MAKQTKKQRTFWASRDKPCNGSIEIWARKPRNASLTTEVWWSYGGDPFSVCKDAALKFFPGLRAGGCKQYKIVEVSNG